VAGTQVAETNCNYPCTGNSSESCGGNSFISVYQDPTFPPDNTSVITDYQPSGCWTESGQGRTLIFRQNQVDGSTMTVESCLFACKAGGYPLAGVEFSVSKVLFKRPIVLTVSSKSVTVGLFLGMEHNRST
jgi:hypothetical protein